LQNAVANLSNIDIDFASVLPDNVKQLLQAKNITPDMINAFLGKIQKELNLTALAAQAFDSLTDYVPPDQRHVNWVGDL
jgi:hypothetical protein